jgi:O-methyltransferase involved in polyketide biosynthesis
MVRRCRTMTAQTLDHLTPMQKFPPITLKGWALDSRTKHSALGDPLADELIRAIDYGMESVKTTWGLTHALAVRAKMLDQIVRDFLTVRPNAVFVELDCGLDTRAFPIDMAAGVYWYDVDFDEVIDLH